jgi:hypothetical protein
MSRAKVNRPSYLMLCTSGSAPRRASRARDGPGDADDIPANASVDTRRMPMDGPTIRIVLESWRAELGPIVKK